MQSERIVIAYFAVLIVLIIIAYFLYTSNAAKKPQVTSLSTSTLATTSALANVSTSIQTTTSIIFSSCLSKSSTQTIPNGNFSAGTYANWTIDGPGFGTAPLNLTKANNNNAYYAAPWNGYNGTFFATTFQNGVAAQAGNLTSLPFRVNELYLNFKIISQQNSALYMELLSNGKPKIIVYYNTYASTPNPQSNFANASIPIGTLLCQNATVRVIAGVTGKTSQGRNYIAVGDFVMRSTPWANTTQPINQTITS